MYNLVMKQGNYFYFLFSLLLSLAPFSIAKAQYTCDRNLIIQAKAQILCMDVNLCAINAKTLPDSPLKVAVVNQLITKGTFTSTQTEPKKTQNSKSQNQIRTSTKSKPEVFKQNLSKDQMRDFYYTREVLKEILGKWDKIAKFEKTNQIPNKQATYQLIQETLKKVFSENEMSRMQNSGPKYKNLFRSEGLKLMRELGQEVPNIKDVKIAFARTYNSLNNYLNGSPKAISPIHEVYSKPLIPNYLKPDFKLSKGLATVGTSAFSGAALAFGPQLYNFGEQFYHVQKCYPRENFKNKRELMNFFTFNSECNYEPKSNTLTNLIQTPTNELEETLKTCKTCCTLLRNWSESIALLTPKEQEPKITRTTFKVKESGLK